MKITKIILKELNQVVPEADIKRNVNTLTEYQVIPDTPGITCTGNDIHYDSARDTLMFIFLENGMTGIGEILNP